LVVRSAKTPVFLKFGDDFELDLAAYELRSGGTPVKLMPIPLELLLMLIERRGELVTRDQIVERIWGKGVFLDSDNSINSAISKIRQVLRDDPERPQFVQTVTGRGYRFIAPVSAEARRNDGEVGQYKIRSLAVLPLENFSGDPMHDYFADGMTEALITDLAKIKALRVISRTSVMQYKGVRKSLPQIASELNVDAVIEGSVLRSAERVRIAAQLIHATSDEHLWAESYERDFRDILSLQSEIARQVADQVRIILTPEERARLEIARQVNPEAHELYLKARYHWNKRTEASVRKAISYFHEAIDLDPTQAQGYAGLADCYNILGYYNALPPAEAYPKGRAAALKAVELDDSLAEPHAALGVLKRDFEWDWAGAEAEFQQAVDLNPGCVEAYHWRGTLFSILGRHADAIREKTKALAIDPLSVVIQTDLGRVFYYSRDYDQALKQYQSALDMDPGFGSAHLWLAHVYEQKGMFEQAISELKTGMHLSSDSPYALAKLGHGYAKAGKRDDAHSVLRQLDALSQQRYVSPYDMAIVYVGLQENDEAFKWLQRAFEERSLWMGYLKVEPQFDLLRSYPSFTELLRRIGFPEVS
jgi:TolB-like protein/Tfp pilus assembly protein PilF